MTLSIIPVAGVPEVTEGADLAVLIGEALAAGPGAEAGDVVVVASKVVSKAAGRRAPADPVPGPEAERLARETEMPAPQVQLVLDESSEVLLAAPKVLVVETRHGFVCANAGIDRSNAGPAGGALLLPEDPDAAAASLRGALEGRFGVRLAVLVSDTFGRPFRDGLVNVALGVAGIDAIRDYRGEVDPDGFRLRGTEIAIADELCSAAELVMEKLAKVPVAVVRGYAYPPATGSGRTLLRDPATDYFRPGRA
jgi:coenzyme F420-0:L-glutamate ligase/coenzyme F420-1:gamma-L-glutamate ligase